MIDYASQLWSAYKKIYTICALEKIQRSFTKYIAEYQNLPSSEDWNLYGCTPSRGGETVT